MHGEELENESIELSDGKSVVKIAGLTPVEAWEARKFPEQPPRCGASASFASAQIQLKSIMMSSAVLRRAQGRGAPKRLLFSLYVALIINFSRYNEMSLKYLN